jgi:hypothetical protein
MGAAASVTIDQALPPRVSFNFATSSWKRAKPFASSPVLISQVSASNASWAGVRCGALSAASVAADAVSSGLPAPSRLVLNRNFGSVSPDMITTSDSSGASVSARS